MYIARSLLILSSGLTMLKFISCYSDGYLLADQCRGMNVNHDIQPQNTESPFNVQPENVTLTESEWRTSRITVALSAQSGNFEGFMLDARTCDDNGDVRCDSVGTFSLNDPDNSLLICGDRVVVQPNNLGKTSIIVSWTPGGAGQFFFRAVFVKDYSTFWRRKPIILPALSTTPPPAETTAPTTTLPLTAKPTIFTTAPSIDSHATGTSTAPPNSEANSTQTNSTTSATIVTSNIDATGTSAAPNSEANSTQTNSTTSATIVTTMSNITSQTTGTSAAPNSEANSTQTNSTTSTTIVTTTSNITSQTTVTPTSPPQCVQYVRSVLALLLFSRLCFLGGSSLLIIRPVLKKTVTKSVSVLELASKTIAAILILIKAIKYECVHECAGLRNVFTALTVTAMVSSLLHTITVFLYCGPSHELRKCWVCSIIIVDLINTIITTTAIFFGTWCFEERWLSILMGVYVVWEIMLYLGSVCFEQMGKYQTRKKVRTNQNRILERRKSPWLLMFIIFTIFSVLLTAALMTGVSLARMIN